MKNQNTRKIVAIFTAVSLAFLQAVPAGVASTKPVDAIDGTSVPTSEKPATTESPTQAVNTQPVVVPQTSTDFMGGGGALSRSTENGTASNAETETNDASVSGEPKEALAVEPVDLGGVENVNKEIPVPAESLSQVQEILASPELLATARGILGTGVARGVALIRTNIEGAATVTNFYDGNGTFMGSYLTNPSLPPIGRPSVWRDAAGNILLTKVQAYASQLLVVLGGGFSATPVVQKDGSYLIMVRDSKIYAKAPTSGLYSMSIAVSKDGIFTSMQGAVYYGAKGNVMLDSKASQLLFQGTGSLMLSSIPKGMRVMPPSAEQVLRVMSQIKVTLVDADGAIHFVKDGVAYKAYRDKTGKVKVVDEVKALQAEILARIAAEIARLEAELANSKARFVTQQAAWEKAVAQLKKDLEAGKVDAGSIRKALEGYLSQAGVSDVLKEEISAYLEKGGSLLAGLAAAEAAYVAYLKVGVNMNEANVRVTQSYLNSLIAHQAKVTAAGTFADLESLRDLPPRAMLSEIAVEPVADPRIALKALLEAGRTLKSKLAALPPLRVRTFASQLLVVLGGGFSATPVVQKDGSYLIMVRDSKIYAKAPTSGLYSMSIAVSKDGIFTSMQGAVYYGAKGNVMLGSKASQLLFQGTASLMLSSIPKGMRVMPPSAEQVLRVMSQIKVTSIDTTGAIHFVKDGVYYKAYRDKTGKVIVRRELRTPAFA